MAYVFKSALVRKKSLDALWEVADVSNMDINAIFSTYKRVWLTLTNTILLRDVYLDLAAVRLRIGLYVGTRTLSSWLAALGNEALPTTDVQPTIIQKSVLYSDAWRAGYNIKAVDRKRHPDADIPRGERNDLLLSKSDVDFRLWGKYCLVTVNGLYHRVSGAVDGLYVIDGGRTGRMGNDNHVGIHSFREVGQLETIPILPNMLVKTHPDQQFRNYVNIHLPKSVENKTVLLVLGGYLHVLDSTYKMIAPQTLRVDMNNFAFPERIYDSIAGMNLEPLGLETSPNNALQFAVADLYSDRAITAYFTLPQSFLVVVDTPEMYVRTHELEKTGLPGRYLSYPPFKALPLVAGLGRAFDYQPFVLDGICTLACDSALDKAYNFNTTQWKLNNSIDPTKESAKPISFSRARLLEYGRIS